MMTDEELVEMAFRHQEAVFERYLVGRQEPVRLRTGECTADDQPWPCDATRLLDHIGLSAVGSAVGPEPES